MRVRLYNDRTQLEKVISETERTLSRRALSLPLVEDAARLYGELERFAYVGKLSLSQSDEKRLQERFMHARAACEKTIADGIPRLSHELRYAPLELQRRTQRIYESVGGIALPTVPPHIALKIDTYKRELQEIFSIEHIVSDGSLQKQCLRVISILGELKRHTKAGAATGILAGELLSYARREGAHLKTRLAEHLSKALITYPSMLLDAGKSRLESEELMHIYEQECSTVEHLLDAIIKEAATPEVHPIPREKQLIVGASSMAVCDALEHQLRGYGAVERFRYIPYMAVFTGESQAAELLRRPKRLFKEGTAVYEARPYTVKPAVARFHSTLWNLDMVQAPQAWEHTRGNGAVVAVIDTGVDYSHSDLEGRFGSVQGVDFVNDSDPYDDNGHGTHVAGTIAGSKTGLAPDSTLYAVKVLDAEGSGSEVDVLRGIEWAIERNVHVINMSLGSSYSSEPEAKLIALAAQNGIAVACAAGNDGDDSYNYPASYPGAISVAAVDRYKDRARFSNYNDEVDLCAPGLEVYSTWPGGGYQVLSGTSMASPHVAGACALLASAGVGDIETALKESAERLGRQDYYGSGLIQLEEALNGKG